MVAGPSCGAWQVEASPSGLTSRRVEGLDYISEWASTHYEYS